jgi:hypothetical protein
MKVGRNFADQLRIAADDPSVTNATLRESMRDAAGVIDTQQVALLEHVAYAENLRLKVSILAGLLLTGIGVALGLWSIGAL